MAVSPCPRTPGCPSSSAWGEAEVPRGAGECRGPTPPESHKLPYTMYIPAGSKFSSQTMIYRKC